MKKIYVQSLLCSCQTKFKALWWTPLTKDCTKKMSKMSKKSKKAYWKVSKEFATLLKFLRKWTEFSYHWRVSLFSKCVTQRKNLGQLNDVYQSGQKKSKQNSLFYGTILWESRNLSSVNYFINQDLFRFQAFREFLSLCDPNILNIAREIKTHNRNKLFVFS